MASKSFRGIDGVLNNLISSPLPTAVEDSQDDPGLSKSSASSSSTRQLDSRRPSQLTTARRGRPVGHATQVARHKQKATFRISVDLLADYRDWSWEARCSLSALVEQAMSHYRRYR